MQPAHCILIKAINTGFLILLWDKLTPQIQDCINLLQHLRITPNKFACETLERPLQFQLVPASAEPSAPHGLDAWYLGPSKNHYHCHHYYVPKTRGYRISGSPNLFPQHCGEPLYSHYSHIQELSSELQDILLTIRRKAKTLKVLKLLA